MSRKRKRTKEEADELCKKLGILAAIIFIPSLSLMNYGSLSMNRGLFFASFMFALIGAVLGGWAIKIRTGRLSLGIVGASFLYIIAAMIFAFSIILLA